MNDCIDEKTLGRIAALFEDSLYNYRDRLINNMVESEDEDGTRIISINGSENFIFDEIETIEEEYLQNFMEEVERILQEEE